MRILILFSDTAFFFVLSFEYMSSCLNWDLFWDIFRKTKKTKQKKKNMLFA